MAKSMSPSVQEMTDGQIDKATDAYRAMLRKHRSEFGSEAVQQILMQDGYLNDQLGVLRRRVEAISDIIWCEVEVNRDMDPQTVIDATGRAQYTNPDSVQSMPRGEGKKVRMGFFKPESSEYTRPGFMSDDDLEKALERRGLKSDPYAQMKANQQDPAFADSRPNGCHWKDAKGRWHYAAFLRWVVGGRYVHVFRFDVGWYDSWWFGGVRK